MELALRFPDGCSSSIASCMCIEKDLLYDTAPRPDLLAIWALAVLSHHRQAGVSPS